MGGKNRRCAQLSLTHHALKMTKASAVALAFFSVCPQAAPDTAPYLSAKQRQAEK